MAVRVPTNIISPQQHMKTSVLRPKPISSKLKQKLRLEALSHRWEVPLRATPGSSHWQCAGKLTTGGTRGWLHRFWLKSNRRALVAAGSHTKVQLQLYHESMVLERKKAWCKKKDNADQWFEAVLFNKIIHGVSPLSTECCIVPRKWLSNSFIVFAAWVWLPNTRQGPCQADRQQTCSKGEGMKVGGQSLHKASMEICMRSSSSPWGRAIKSCSLNSWLWSMQLLSKERKWQQQRQSDPDGP